MSITAILAAIVLVVGIPLNAYVTVKLWRLALAEKQLGVLRDRAIVATTVLFVVVVFGLLFVNNDLLPPPIDFPTTKFISRTALLIVALGPAAYWLRIYR